MTCTCGHTSEEHEVTASQPIRALRLDSSTLYTSYCKVPNCKCEIYKPSKTKSFFQDLPEAIIEF